MIGVDSGWEIYVAGNGGIKTEVAQFLVKVKTADEVLEYAGAFLQLYREEGWYLERTVHYVARVGLDHVKQRVLDDAEGRRALWERLQFALDGEPDPWHETAKARIDLRQFVPIVPVGTAVAGRAGATRSRRDDGMDGSRSLRHRRRSATPDSRCATLTDIPRLGARVVERPGDAARQRRDLPHRRRSRVRPRRPLPAQGRAAVAGHRLRRSRRLPAAQLEHRACTPGRERARRRLRGALSRARRRRAASTSSSIPGDAASDAMAETRSTCCYCGVGCGVVIEHDGARITGVRGDPDHPANRGKLCSKGSTLHLTAQPDAQRFRATQPLVRAARGAARSRRRRGTPRSTTLADRFAACIRTHGPDSVAFYVSGQLLTEDYYVFNKLAKGLIGTNNIDTNSRLCMSSAVAGYKATLGADAPPACYDDIDHADLPLHRRLEHRVGASDPVPPHRGGEGAQPGAEDRRRRPAPHGDRASSPTCTWRSSPAPTSRCSTACCT